MGKAGFSFVLFGMESANQSTLDMLNKGEQVGDLESSLQMAKGAGLEPHLTIMVGYPWETGEDVAHTMDTARRFLDRGLVRSLQATLVIPYPGTRLFDQARDAGWLKTEDWARYDMSEPVLRTDHEEESCKLVRGMYKACLTPRYLARRIFSIRSWDDFTYFVRSAKYLLGHLKDFKSSKGGSHENQENKHCGEIRRLRLEGF
jgi:radical SAM superfamily enzyme YgiQ (UPF0313 family)